MVGTIAGAINAYKQSAGVGLGINGGGAQDVASDAGGFANALQGFMHDSVQALRQGEQAAAAGAAGKANLQDVVMAVNNAEVMLQTITSIRDKVIAAYQEILRMPV